MGDYISKKALLEKLKYMGDYNINMDYVTAEDIMSIPCADVRENIHGEWEEVTDYKDDNVYQWHIICSVCRQRGMFESDKFCPNCGADMRGE